MSFELVFPQTIEEAMSAQERGAPWFAGGTDLVPEIKRELASPTRLVNLKRIEGLGGIRETEQGVVIGALTTLSEIAESDLIRTRYRALAQACDLAASPQIRNAATIGGNLCQDSRCAYYRNGFYCLLRGGDKCYMREGENREAAIIGYKDCVHVHPSDPAIALVAFDAEIQVRGRAGERTIAAAELFRAPDAADPRMTVLTDGDLVTAIVLPKVSDTTRSAYLKAMDRATWAFALASACVRVDLQSGQLENVRLVLGAVAPVPWRERAIEQQLSGKQASLDSVTQGLNVLEDAMPLTHNGYKLRLGRAMAKRALSECLTDS